MIYTILDTKMGRKGYSIPHKGNEEIISNLKELLTVSPKINEDFGAAKEFPVYRENSTRFYVPRYFGLQKFGLPSKEEAGLKGDLCKRLSTGFVGSLKEEQVSVVAEMKKALEDPLRRGGIMELPCGFGKTTLTLYLLAQLQRKTLVICHKDFLITQWKERAQQFLPGARIGIIKQDKAQVDDYDIVIASLQSLAMRDYDAALFSGFGVVVVDECHHIAAEVFSRALPKVTCHYMIGLSATLTRKDGLTKVIKWFLGDTAVKIQGRDVGCVVVVKQVKYYDADPEYGQEIYMNRKSLSIPKMMNAILAFEPRNRKLIDAMIPVIREKGRQVLVLSERRGHLEQIEKLLLGEFGMPELAGDIGYYIGGMSDAEQKKSTTKRVILATAQMTSEGFDVPSLNTLVLAAPPLSGHIEQVVGRILRGHGERKVQPLVLDFIDDFSIFARYGGKRKKFYESQGFELIDSRGNRVLTKEEINEKKLEEKITKPTFIMLDDDLES